MLSLRNDKMTMQMKAVIWAMLAMLSATSAQARIVRLVVDKVSSPNFDGESFGVVGAYEKLEGHVVGEVDPAQHENRLIQDLSRAPRTPRGTVEYTADFILLKPIDTAKGNGLLDINLVNRGRTLGLTYNVGARTEAGLGSVNPTTRADAGDGFLMRRGYSILYLGWQADLAEDHGLLRLHAPVAAENGRPITGKVRVTLAIDRPAQTVGIAGGGAPQVAYRAARLDEPTASLRHHGSAGAPWIETPRIDWAFANCDAAAFPGQPDPVRICVRRGFDPSQVYDLSYTARDPLVLGLGLSAIRDASAFFRYDAKDQAGAANPLAGHVQHVIVTGLSQAGNLMRNIVQLGFTRDEGGRPAFDGMMAHLSGKRTPITIRFGAPGATTTLFEGPLLPGHERPLTWSREPDPITRVRAGLLDRCTATNSCPKIINTWTSTEYRQYAIAYTAVDAFGQHDLTLPPNVRAYFLTGSQHGTWDSQSKPMPAGVCVNAKNNGPNEETQRALLVAMEDWVIKGTQPPPSRIATLAAGQLAAPNAIGFPTIPGVTYTTQVLTLDSLDFGPQYRPTDQSGVLAPPPSVASSKAFPPLLPIVDADGNETAGVRPSALQAPLGTYTGWNLRGAGHGAGELCGLSGSFIPLTRTKAEREVSGDPRLSIAERYGTHDGYVAAVRKAVRSLRDSRLLLPEDADRLVQEAQASNVLR